MTINQIIFKLPISPSVNGFSGCKPVQLFHIWKKVSLEKKNILFLHFLISLWLEKKARLFSCYYLFSFYYGSHKGVQYAVVFTVLLSYANDSLSASKSLFLWKKQLVDSWFAWTQSPTCSKRFAYSCLHLYLCNLCFSPYTAVLIRQAVSTCEVW